jgi:hypothetical protein
MKVVFDFAKQQISIDGDEQRLLEVLGVVRQIAPLLTKIEITTSAAAPQSLASSPRLTLPSQTGSDTSQAGNGAPLQTGQTGRQFVRRLVLDNAYERIAAIAYYYKTYEGRQFFSPKEMDNWFAICGFQKPSQMPVAMSDASRKYGFVESSARGQWRLTTSGENLIIGKLNQAEKTSAE